MRDLARIFKLKQILKAWRSSRTHVDRFIQRRTSSLSVDNYQVREEQACERRNKLTFCVTYSDFCKCERCTEYRQSAADIMPSQQLKAVIKNKSRQEISIAKQKLINDEKRFKSRMMHSG